MKFDVTIGEIILVRLSRELVLCQYERAVDKQIVCLYNKKLLRVRQSNIVLLTRFVPKSDDELKTFINDCQNLAKTIDVESIWEVLENQNKPFSLSEITDLYFSKSSDSICNTAMAILLDKDKYYFKSYDQKYLPSRHSEVEKIKNSHKKSIEAEKTITCLLTAMSQNVLPEKLTSSQKIFLTHLKQYAIHGEDYKNKHVIKPFFLKLKSDKSIQHTVFDLLVATNIFNKHEPVELQKIGGINSPDISWISEIDSEISTLLNSNRLNLAKTDIVTIDDQDTKERDDAFSVKETDKKFEIGIHIADPSTLINPDGLLDKSARYNVSSIYLPEKTIPMLPGQFIKEFGSLDPSKTRPGLSLIIKTDLNYKIECWRIVPSIITTTKAITYEEASLALKHTDNSDYQMMSHLWNFSKKQMCLRKQNGAIDLQTQEMNIKVSSESEIEISVLNSRTDSRVMVSELMILFNSLAAKFFVKNDIPAIYRHQPSPSIYDDSDFDLQQASQNEISKNYHLIRKLPKTKLTGEPLPHYSLGLQSYVQITSPLRRYSDMLLQRQIVHFLCYGKFLYSQENLETLAFGSYSRIKDIRYVERERQRYWLIKYLENILNAGDSSMDRLCYTAVVLEKSNYGMKSLVQILEFAFRQRINLPSYCQIGDEISLNLVSVNTWNRTARFQFKTS